MTQTTTASEFNREPSSFLRAAEKGVATVITKHGESAAALIPQPGVTSGDAVARAFAGLKPDPKTASEVERIIAGVNEAE